MFPPSFELIEPIDLFNILNSEIDGLSRISDNNYLYLLDCRTRKDYDESHIISAIHLRRDEKGNYQIPWRSEFETRQFIVVYDSSTQSLPLKRGNEIYDCAELLENHAGGLITIKILSGGYELFSKHYPFLRSQQSLYSAKELQLIKTYPNEILGQFLYLGRREHAINSQMMKDLKIRVFVNCSKHEDYIIPTGDSRKYFRLSIDDNPNVEGVDEHFDDAVRFISVAHDRADPVLVYSDRGVSRSAAVVIAFISFHRRINSRESFEFVNQHRPVRPQKKFIEIVDRLNEKLNHLQESMSNIESSSINEQQ